MPTRTKATKAGKKPEEKRDELADAEHDRFTIGWIVDNEPSRMRYEALTGDYSGDSCGSDPLEIVLGYIETLCREISRLREEIVGLNGDISEATAEIRTRRVVIVDTDGQERVVLDGGHGNNARFAMYDPDLNETFRIESDAEGTALHVRCGSEAGGEEDVRPCFVAAMRANPDEQDWGHVSVYTPDDEYVTLAGGYAGTT